MSPSARAADGVRADREGDRYRVDPHAALVFDLEALIGVADRFRGAGWNVQGLAAGIGEAFPGAAVCGVRVMQWSVDARVHVISLCSNSSSSVSYSDPICSRRRRVISASASSTIEIAKPTWISTQSPSFAPSSPPLTSATFTHPADAGDVDACEKALVIDELDYLSGYR